jgi:coenzyme Q-binding protein COQ10
MTSYQVEHIVNYKIDDIYNMIIDIESYPEFLPWCSAARIIEEGDHLIIADLVITFKVFTEHYRSQVELTPPNKGMAEIKATALSGPFKHLDNQWVLQEIKKNVTKIKFMIDFKFKSALLNNMIGFLFAKASEKMVDAFEKRAEELYSLGGNGSRNPKGNRSRAKSM